mgnify:CR=1 FL=1
MNVVIEGIYLNGYAKPDYKDKQTAYIFKNIVINFIRGIAANRGIEKINDIENQLTDKNIEIKI